MVCELYLNKAVILKNKNKKQKDMDSQEKNC